MQACGTNPDIFFRGMLVLLDIGFTQLPNITGVIAVQSFSSKHDLEGSDDDEPGEMYVFLCFGHMTHIRKQRQRVTLH